MPSMHIFGGYKASKLKPQLKMAVTRFQISANKKSALTKQQIREIAQLLSEQPNPKEEKARIKAEALIRDDNTVEAYEILQLTCDLLSERINLITQSRECPPDLKSSVSTLIWASAIVDVPELVEIRKQFRYKYGQEFDDDAMANVGGVINERVAAKLSVQPPSAYLVQTYLEKIAEDHEISWKPKVPLTASDMAEPMSAPVGYSVPVGGGSGLMPNDYGQLPADSASTTADPEIRIASAPPMSPSYDIPEAPNSSAASQTSTYVPVLPTPSLPPGKIDDIEEVDIFVPGAPKNPPGSANYQRRQDNDDDDSDVNGAGGQITNGGRDVSAGTTSTGGGGGDESYDDLAARFAMLQK